MPIRVTRIRNGAVEWCIIHSRPQEATMTNVDFLFLNKSKGNIVPRQPRRSRKRGASAVHCVGARLQDK